MSIAVLPCKARSHWGDNAQHPYGTVIYPIIETMSSGLRNETQVLLQFAGNKHQTSTHTNATKDWLGGQ